MAIEQANRKSDEEIIQELCTCNGISYSKVMADKKAAELVVSVEMFFFGFPRLVGFHLFPNLRKIVVMDQEVACIEGLETCNALKELWICECRMTVIQGLDGCSGVEKLCLYSNAIERIEGIDHMKGLHTLWLNDNKIKHIQGLEGLTELRDLNLALNDISKIGDLLNEHVNLEILNLSNNPLTSLKDLTNLSPLQKLKDLRLQDPQFGSSPVCFLCNYATHLLFHLPTLTELDTYDVSSQAIQELACNIVVRKKLFYETKVRLLDQETEERIVAGCQEAEVALNSLKRRMKVLLSSTKEIEMQMNDEIALVPSVEGRSRSDLGSAKREALIERLAMAEAEYQKLQDYMDEVKETFQAEMMLMKNLLLLELEAGGNIYCEKGQESDLWYTACSELIRSRFNASDYAPFSLTGVEIRGVYKIHNRALRAQFEERLERVLEREETPAATKKKKAEKLMEYLFLVRWGVNPGEDVMSAVEYGPLSPSQYKDLGFECAAVPLTNSLHAAEERKRGSLKPGREYAVVCKVYTGVLEKARQGEEIYQLSYDSADSVYVPLPEGQGDSKEWKSMFYLFKKQLVLPEYLVEYEFTPQAGHALPVSELPSDSDRDVLGMEPHFAATPRLVFLNEEIVLQRTGAQSMSAIRVLNLHNNGLTRLTALSGMPELTKLVVSCNELTTLDGVRDVSNLRYLDVSVNKLSTLDGLHSLHSLVHLDVSWNKLTHIRNVLTVLRKQCSSLTSLDTRHNQWKRNDPEHRMHVLGRVKQLQAFDGVVVSEDEMAAAVRNLVTSRVSVAMLMSKSWTDREEPRSLLLGSVVRLLSRRSKLKLQKIPSDEGNTSFWSQVTVLNLEWQGLTKISNLTKLRNLRWASFAHNSLTKIEGLEDCESLEELSLEDNYVMRLEGLGHLSHLCSLNVARNFISSLPSWVLTNLTSLTYFNLDHNKVVSPSSLQKCTSLSQLYLAHNFVSSIREIFPLKQLSNLLVLDLHGNPVTVNVDSYRLSVIFHLKTVKALDNTIIEPSEVSLAKEKLGGRLSLDFIAERVGVADLLNLAQADFVQCGLKQIDLGNAECLKNLTSLNLENNSLTSLDGLTALENLRVLCLNNNHIGSIVTPAKSEPCRPVLENLQVLHLAYNGIVNMAELQLSRLTGLRCLFLQGNEISRVEGLDGMTSLLELVLDKNKIKGLLPHSFSSQYNLEELHIEENRLKDLSHFEALRRLVRLYLGMNRIQDIAEIEKLGCLRHLWEISLISNPATRKQLHRPLLVYRLAEIRIIDGLEVSDEERMKLEFYFSDQAGNGVGPEITGMHAPSLKTALRVNTVCQNAELGALASPYTGGGGGAAIAGSMGGLAFHVSGIQRREHPQKRFPFSSETSRVITGVDGHMYRGMEASPWMGRGRQHGMVPRGPGPPSEVNFGSLSNPFRGSEWYPQASVIQNRKSQKKPGPNRDII